MNVLEAKSLHIKQGLTLAAAVTHCLMRLRQMLPCIGIAVSLKR